MAAFCSSGIARADAYRFLVLDVPGGTDTAARGINRSGEIVGSNTQSGSTIGFLYRGGSFSHIEVPGATNTTASGIDNAGQIAGFYSLGGNVSSHGFLYAAGSYSTIDVPGATSTQALAINDGGQIVGAFTDAHGQHAFLKAGESFTAIDVPGAASTTATGINNSGEVVGTYVDSNSRVHGFLYTAGLFSTLDAPNGEQPRTLGINEAGQIVGLPGLLYRDGTFAKIELAGAHGGIDDAGRIVGSYRDANGERHGFLATPASQPILTAGGSSTGRATASAPAIAANFTAKASPSPSPCDITGNGTTDISDAQQIIREALGTAAAGNDVNSDHVVNVVDVQVVMIAVLHLGCTPVGGQQGGGGTVAHLSVQSGNGQVLCILPSCTLQAWQPISVKATDSGGNPVAGATVSWAVTNGQIMLGDSPGTSNTTTVADGNGIATQSLSEIIFSWTDSFNAYRVNNIQATANNISVTFTETQALQVVGASEIEGEPPRFNGALLGDAPLSAPSGTTLSTPIQEQVAGLGQASNGVPNISVRIINQQDSPTLTCVTGANADPGSVLSDAQGNTACYPIFSGSGTGTYYVALGGVAGGSWDNGALYFSALGPLTFTATVGPPTTVQIVSGNNQTVPVNQPLNPLVARVVDSQGHVLIGQPMVWTVSPASAAILGISPTQTDSNGEISTTFVTLSSSCGSGCSITVAVQGNPGVSATFHEALPGG